MVQPFPSLVPNPTRKPPSRYPVDDTTGTSASVTVRESSSAVGSMSRYIRVAPKRARTNQSFHRCSGPVSVALGETTKEDMRPDAPRTSPLKRRRAAAGEEEERERGRWFVLVSAMDNGNKRRTLTSQADEDASDEARHRCKVLEHGSSLLLLQCNLFVRQTWLCVMREELRLTANASST